MIQDALRNLQLMVCIGNENGIDRTGGQARIINVPHDHIDIVLTVQQSAYPQED